MSREKYIVHHFRDTNNNDVMFKLNIRQRKYLKVLPITGSSFFAQRKGSSCVLITFQVMLMALF